MRFYYNTTELIKNKELNPKSLINKGFLGASSGGRYPTSPSLYELRMTSDYLYAHQKNPSLKLQELSVYM